MTSTVSFATADIKAKVIKQLADNHANWEIDDHFAGLTVISAPENVDTEWVNTDLSLYKCPLSDDLGLT